MQKRKYLYNEKRYFKAAIIFYFIGTLRGTAEYGGTEN